MKGSRSIELRTLFRMYGYLRESKARVAIAAATVLAAAMISVFQPQLVRYIVDRGIRGNDAAFLLAASAFYLALAAFRGFVVFAQGRNTEIMSQGVAYRLRKEIHERLTSLSFSFHDKAQSGQLLSRAIQDVERIRFLTGRASLRLIEGSVLLAVTTVALIVMNPLLALLATPALPILAWRAFRFGLLVRPLSMEAQDRLAALTGVIEQNLRATRVVRAYAQEEREIAKFAEENERWFTLTNRLGRIQAVQGPMLTLIADSSLAIVLGFGGYLVTKGKLSLGELVAFTTYMAQLAQPVRMMGVIAPVVGMAAASGERIVEILDAEGEVREAPDAEDFPQLSGMVEFKNLGFAYSGRSPALYDLNLTIRPGEIVAFAGATGSGKTTIMHLVPRFYDATSGSVLMDGRDVKRAKLASLRRHIGIVLQEATLFAVSIRENIAFGVPDATEEAIVGAAKSAQAHDFILSLPAGYDTVVGERGSTLSGGQRQRIAIARAILKDPRILLLDDATSSVDAATEREIQKALENLMKGRTCLIVAHRLSTLRMADRIVVLDKGRMTACGTHEELSASSRAYADLVRRQTERRPGAEEAQE